MRPPSLRRSNIRHAPASADSDYREDPARSSAPGARVRPGSPRQCLRVHILPHVRQFAISNRNDEDPVVLERPVRGLDSARSEADHQNPVSLRDELRRLRVGSLHRIVSLLKETLQPRVPTVRTGQWPAIARNDPLNIFSRQRQQTLLIATAKCRQKILNNLNVLFNANRFSLPLPQRASDRIGHVVVVLPRQKGSRTPITAPS